VNVSLWDAQVVVWHRVFVKNPASTGRHGSAEEGTLSDPIERKVYQVYPARWQRPTPDPINIEDLTNTITNLVMDCPDPSIFKTRDQVLINGVAFLVQGLPAVDANWGNGTQMLPEYDSLFGGQVLIRRVG
jgi:hypothetical protein